MTVLLHRAGRRNLLLAREAARLLAGALGGEVGLATGGAGEWTLLGGGELVEGPRRPPERLVVLPRRDPRWSLEDLPKRPLVALPPGTRVVVPSDLGAFLLLRARPDLVPVRAGTFPFPEETPVLAEGPVDGRPGGDPLDPAGFLPAPGTGLAALLAEGAVPPAVRALEDGEARTLLTIERGLVEGVGDLPEGAALGVLARRKVSVLFGLRAVLFRPGQPPREVAADIPLENAGVFARGFGQHLRT
jgi:hypothetical protein